MHIKVKTKHSEIKIKFLISVKGEKRMNLTEVAVGLSAYFLIIAMKAARHWNILNVLREKAANTNCRFNKTIFQEYG